MDIKILYKIYKLKYINYFNLYILIKDGQHAYEL